MYASVLRTLRLTSLSGSPERISFVKPSSVVVVDLEYIAKEVVESSTDDNFARSMVVVLFFEPYSYKRKEA